MTTKEWGKLYPRLTMSQIANFLGCGETTVHKYLKRAGLKSVKKPRKPRSVEHKKNLSKANIGRTRKRTGPEIACHHCGKKFYVIPARADTAKYCSVSCRAGGVQQSWIGEAHPRYISNVVREKVCENCGKLMLHRPPRPITSFLAQKFCSKVCADSGGFRLSGEAHPNYKGLSARKRSRSGEDSRWALKVIQRDNYTCMRCRRTGEERTLQAHHIFPVEFYPNKRDEISNGVTLCSQCHWEVHRSLDSTYIVLPTEKSLVPDQKVLRVKGKLSETKVFGKDSRKWKGNCYWCGKELVKRLSDVTGKPSVFCSGSCRSKHTRAFSIYRPSKKKMPATVRPPERSNDV